MESSAAEAEALASKVERELEEEDERQLAMALAASLEEQCSASEQEDARVTAALAAAAAHDDTHEGTTTTSSLPSDLRRLPGIQEAALPTQLLGAESHGCSRVGPRDGTPRRGTGRSSNNAPEPEYGRSHGRSLSLPQVGEGVTARALPATQAGREVIDLCSSGDEENESQAPPSLAEEVAGAHTPAAAGLRTPMPPDDRPGCLEADPGGSDSVYVECHHGFIAVEGRQGDPGVTPICRRRGCIRRALKLWRRNGDHIRQADHETGEAHEPVAGEDGVWRVASTTGLHEVFGVHADGCRYSVHIFKASARTHDLDAGFTPPCATPGTQGGGTAVQQRRAARDAAVRDTHGGIRETSASRPTSTRAGKQRAIEQPSAPRDNGDDSSCDEDLLGAATARSLHGGGSVSSSSEGAGAARADGTSVAAGGTTTAVPAEHPPPVPLVMELVPCACRLSVGQGCATLVEIPMHASAERRRRALCATCLEHVGGEVCGCECGSCLQPDVNYEADEDEINDIDIHELGFRMASNADEVEDSIELALRDPAAQPQPEPASPRGCCGAGEPATAPQVHGDRTYAAAVDPSAARSAAHHAVDCGSSAPASAATVPQSFANDVMRSELRVYRDDTAKRGLRRGACVVDVATCALPRLQALCGGVVLADGAARSAVQLAYAISITGTAHTLFGHPWYNWWTLLNEDAVEPANHRFQVWDLTVQADWVLGKERQSVRPRALSGATAEPIHISVVGVVQVAAVGSDGRCTIHYGPSYRRPYGHAKESLLQLELPESALWDLLGVHGLRGRAALEAVLERAAPTDPQDTELRARLQAWRAERGLVGRLTKAQTELTADAPSPAAVVDQGGDAVVSHDGADGQRGKKRGESAQLTRPSDQTRRLEAEHARERARPLTRPGSANAPAEDSAAGVRPDARRAGHTGKRPIADLEPAHSLEGEVEQRSRVARREATTSHATADVPALAERLGSPVYALTAEPQRSRAVTSCHVCGCSGGEFVCYDEDVYLCAKASHGRSCSCLWLYLSLCSERQRFISYETQDFNIVRVRCAASGYSAPLWQGAGPNGAQLGVAPATDSSVGLLLSTTARAPRQHAIGIPVDWSRWQPLVTPQGALSLVTVKGPSNGGHRQQGNVQRTYDSTFQYRALWQRLVRAAGEHERSQCERQRRTGVLVNWQRDLNGSWCVAVFTAPAGSGRVGERYSLARESDGDEQTQQWQGIGTVVKVARLYGSDEVRLAGPTVPREDRNGRRYTVTPLWNATNCERAQTAFRLIAANTALTSWPLMAQLLGVRTAPLSMRVFMPTGDLTPPGMARLDAHQCAAVRGCLQSRLAIIQGPPGTGKTATTAAYVYHLARQGRGAVLVCAPSNAAATRIAEAMHKLGLHVLRHFSKAREAESAAIHHELGLAHHAAGVDSDDARTVGKLIELKAEFGTAAGSDERLLAELQEGVNDEAVRRADVVVCTVMTAGGAELSRQVFKSVVVDEAAQGNEADAVVPLVAGAESLVLVGDHKQLGPIVKHFPSLRAGMGVSQFERLAGGVAPHYLLATQYRMHPALSEYAAHAFYDGLLQDGVTAAQRTSEEIAWPSAAFPGYFHDVPSNDRLVGTSRANDDEAAVVAATVVWLIQQRVQPCDIGVIATYGAQVGVIRRILEREHIDVAVNTVDSYQGQERRVIIISFVRGAGSGGLAFLESASRLNVAMTRCQRGRICIGNASALRKGVLLRTLVEHHEARGVLLKGSVGALRDGASVAAALTTDHGSDATRKQPLVLMAQTCDRSPHGQHGVWYCERCDLYNAFCCFCGELVAPIDESCRCLAPAASTRTRAHTRPMPEPPSDGEVVLLSQAATRALAERGDGVQLLTDYEARGTWAFKVVESLLSDLAPARTGLAPKVTGMLMELDAAELMGLTLRQFRTYIAESLNLLHIPVTHDVVLERPPLGLDASNALQQWALEMDEPLADDADGGNAQAWVTCMDYNAADARGYGYRLPTTELPTADGRRDDVPLHSGRIVDVLYAAPEERLVFLGDTQGAQCTHRVMRAQHRRGLFSRLLLLWRARVVGWMTSAEMVQYWRFARAGHRSELRRLVHRARYSSGREPGGGRSVNLITISPRTGIPVLVCMRTRLEIHAARALEKHNGRYFRVVRNCACWYGMRRVLGRATTEDDRGRAQAQARRVIRWYAAALKPLVALVPHAVFAALFAHPGGHLEAMRLLGASVFGVDNATDMRASQRWFHDLCHSEKRSLNSVHEGGIATLHRGDALQPGDVAAAARLHAMQHTGGKLAVAGHYDTPPCTRYGPLSRMHLPRSKRLVHHQACLSTVVAQRVYDYEQKGEVFLVETVAHGGHYVSGGASVVFVSGHQVGLETRDDHAFITPVDRPFIVDESLRRQGAQIRAGSCAGARPVSALHPCGTPVQNPWSRPCCEGDGLSLYGAGVQAASLSRICAAIGLSEKHLTSKEHAADVLPVLLAMLGGSQLINQALSRIAGIPIISFESAEADANLKGFRAALFQSIVDSASVPRGYPLNTAIIVVFPPMARGRVLVAHTGELMRVNIPTDGVDLVASVTAQLDVSYPQLGLLPRNLRFVARRGGKVAFYSTFVSDATHGVASRRGKTGGTDGTAQTPYTVVRHAHLIKQLAGTAPDEGELLAQAVEALQAEETPAELATSPLDAIGQRAAAQKPIECTRCGADRRRSVCSQCEQRTRCKVCSSCSACVSMGYWRATQHTSALTADAWTGLTLAGADRVRDSDPVEDVAGGGEDIVNGVYIAAVEDATVSEWQSRYAARRRELLKDSAHVHKLSFAPRKPKEGTGDDPITPTVQRVAQLLVMAGDDVVAIAVDHGIVAVFEGLIPELSGRELRALDQGDAGQTSSTWSVRRVLYNAIEPVFGGSSVESRLRQLIGVACVNEPAHRYSRVYPAVDYTGTHSSTAPARKLEYSLYVVQLDGTVDWCSAADDLHGDQWTHSQRSCPTGYEMRLLRTAQTAQGPVVMAPAAVSSTGAAAPFVTPSRVTPPQHIGSVCISSVSDITEHLARTGRGHVAAAITVALGSPAPDPVTNMAQSLWVLQCGPSHGVLATGDYYFPSVEHIRHFQLLHDQVQWSGPREAPTVSIPLAGATFEALLRAGQLEYIIPLAAWPGPHTTLAKGRCFRVINTDNGLAADVEIVHGLHVPRQVATTGVERGPGRHMLLPGVAPAGSLQGVVRARLASRPSSHPQLQPTEAALEITGLMRCVTLIQRAVRQYQAARRSRAATVVQLWVRRHRAQWCRTRAQGGAALAIQCSWRQYSSRSRVRNLRDSRRSRLHLQRVRLIYLQTMWRGSLQRRVWAQRRSAVVTLQAAARGATARSALQLERREAERHCS